MRAAKLEWYEQGDVWHRVITAEHRSAVGDVPPDQLNARAQEVRALLLADSDALMRSGGPLEPVAEWATAFHHTGQTLSHAVQEGTLDRALRQVLSYHVIFTGIDSGCPCAGKAYWHGPQKRRRSTRRDGNVLRPRLPVKEAQPASGRRQSCRAS